jgi:hypothetical protein
MHFSGEKMSKQHYVNNAQFFQAIVEYKRLVKDSVEKGLDKPRISDYIGECLYKIANKLSTKPCFIGYSFRDEMISDGVENCIVYFDDYDPLKSQNPFAYFTQIIFYAFLRRIGKEEKNRYIIYKNFQDTMTNNDISLFIDSEDKHMISTQVYDNINDFMDKYERKENIKKEKRRNSKEGLLKYYGE